MKRPLLIAALLILPTASHAQAVVRGVAIGTTCRLTDSLLNPGVPVPLTWDATLGGWEGAGNGMTYRLVEESSEWKIRAVVAGGNFALLWQPVDLSGKSPLRWKGFIPTAGPMWTAYNYLPWISPPPYPFLLITITP